MIMCLNQIGKEVETITLDKMLTIKLCLFNKTFNRFKSIF